MNYHVSHKLSINILKVVSSKTKFHLIKRQKINIQTETQIT